MKHVLLLLFFFVMFGAAAKAQQGSNVNLSVFPNPTTEYISVQDDNDIVSHVVVFNLVGKKMKVFPFLKGESYYVADLPKGMYLVQIIDKSSKVLNTQKLNKR